MLIFFNIQILRAEQYSVHNMTNFQKKLGNKEWRKCGTCEEGKRKERERIQKFHSKNYNSRS